MKDMKTGDLVIQSSKLDTLWKKQNLGVGLVVRQLPDCVDTTEARWAVRWSMPTWVMDDGCSVTYTSEMVVISRAKVGDLENESR